MNITLTPASPNGLPSRNDRNPIPLWESMLKQDPGFGAYVQAHPMSKMSVDHMASAYADLGGHSPWEPWGDKPLPYQHARIGAGLVTLHP